MSTEERIKKQISDNSILLFMKGSPDKPQCGFSQRATQILMACGKEFSFVDILSIQDIRETLPSISNWPTFPQLFINGELIGGSDIALELYESGDLQMMLSDESNASE